MHNTLFVRGQSSSVKIFDRSRNGSQVIGLGTGNDFHGPLGQTLPLPSRAPSSLAPITSKRLLHRLPTLLPSYFPVL